MNNHAVDVLLVEDNPDDEELALEALSEYRLTNRIYVARDGEEALEFLFRTGRFASADCRRDAPRVILLDLKLPKVSGLEVLKRIRSAPTLHHTPVVVLTSSREERDIIESYKLGVNSYVVKPVTFEQFVESVRHVGMYWLLLNEPPVAAGGGLSA
jgi:CheY-like chemotaxis protein